MNLLNSEQILMLLLAITLMLAFGRIFGELFRKIKQAAVVGEIIAGIILGPTIFGAIFPGVYDFIFPETGPVAVALEALVNLAIIFLLLVVGFEIDLGVVLKQGKAALLTGTTGILFPFLIGGSAALFLPSLFGVNTERPVMLAFFIATALAVSALPIIARTLMDLNLFKSKLGMTIMAAAMFNDFIGWIIFSVFLGLIDAGAHSGGVTTTIIYTLVFVFLMLFIFRKVIHKILPWIQSELSWPGGIISFVMVMALIGAAITEKIGVHSIFGAFIVGVAIGDSAHLSFRTREIVNQFITNIFAPLFFVSIGLKMNFVEAFDPVVTLVILVIGFAGKIIGCGLGAYWSGFKMNESIAVGFAMNARGVLEIVLSIFALQAGIIDPSIFVGIIILVLLSSILSGPLMSLFTKDIKSYTLTDLLSSKGVIFSHSHSREEIIKELSEKAAAVYKLNTEKILNAVWEREKLLPTGIQNHLAIPHAKVDIQKPVVLAAVSKEGIDFEANDKLPSKIIFLLLTPKNKNELQLQLLAEIASKFKYKENIENLINSNSVEEFMSNIKQKL